MADPDAALQTNNKPEATIQKGDMAEVTTQEGEATTQQDDTAEETTPKGDTSEAAPRTGDELKPQVQYVISGKPTGMAAMANAVQEYDDERVDSCKDDIDTLLVFVRTLRALPG